jgi:hypothetical protein
VKTFLPATHNGLARLESGPTANLDSCIASAFLSWHSGELGAVRNAGICMQSHVVTWLWETCIWRLQRTFMWR